MFGEKRLKFEQNYATIMSYSYLGRKDKWI